MIHFRTKKYGSHADSSYFLKDGPDIKDMAEMLIGDSVSISWPCEAKHRDALENLDPRVIGRDFYVTDSYSTNGEMRITTPCVVAERSHGIARHKGMVGDLRYYGLSITLEATNGYVEDMLLWIMLGERPAWAGGN
jgi:hypothetical protein